MVCFPRWCRTERIKRHYSALRSSLRSAPTMMAPSTECTDWSKRCDESVLPPSLPSVTQHIVLSSFHHCAQTSRQKIITSQAFSWLNFFHFSSFFAPHPFKMLYVLPIFPHFRLFFLLIFVLCSGITQNCTRRFLSHLDSFSVSSDLLLPSTHSRNTTASSLIERKRVISFRLFFVAYSIDKERLDYLVCDCKDCPTPFLSPQRLVCVFLTGSVSTSLDFFDSFLKRTQQIQHYFFFLVISRNSPFHTLLSIRSKEIIFSLSPSQLISRFLLALSSSPPLLYFLPHHFLVLSFTAFNFIPPSERSFMYRATETTHLLITVRIQLPFKGTCLFLSLSLFINQ